MQTASSPSSSTNVDASKGAGVTVTTIDAYQVQTSSNLFTNNENSTSSCSSSDLKYLHKKFKRMASTSIETVASAPPTKSQPDATAIVTERSLRFNGYSVKNVAIESTKKSPSLTNGDVSLVPESELLIQHQHQSYDRLTASAPSNNHRHRDRTVVTSSPSSIPLFAHKSDINATCDFSSKKISANSNAAGGKMAAAASSSSSSMEDGSGSSQATAPIVANAPGRYVCSFCQLNCSKPSVLRKHIRAHTNERPYPCASCGIAFKTKSNLNKHYR